MSDDAAHSSNPGDEGKAPEAAQSEHLNLKVKSQDGNEVYFKVKKTTQFSKVMSAYCKKVGADLESVRFLFDGQRLRPDQTPQDVRRTRATLPHRSSSRAAAAGGRVRKDDTECTLMFSPFSFSGCSFSARHGG